jgi:hypothetical protein
MSASFDRNETRRQTFKFATERRDSRRQEPAGDYLRLIVQDAEVTLSVAKIDTDRHSSNNFTFSKINQRTNIRVLLHFAALLFLHSLDAFRSGSLLQPTLTALLIPS